MASVKTDFKEKKTVPLGNPKINPSLFKKTSEIAQKTAIPKCNLRGSLK